MFRPSDRQATFGSLAVRLSPEKRAYLDAKYWSGALRRKALPLRLECERLFATRFCSDNGRPNKPVAQVVGPQTENGDKSEWHCRGQPFSCQGFTVSRVLLAVDYEVFSSLSSDVSGV